MRIRIDLKGPGSKTKAHQLLPTKGRSAVICSKTGDRAWMVDLPADPNAESTDMVQRWALIADYTESRPRAASILNTCSCAGGSG